MTNKLIINSLFPRNLLLLFNFKNIMIFYKKNILPLVR